MCLVPGARVQLSSIERLLGTEPAGFASRGSSNGDGGGENLACPPPPTSVVGERESAERPVGNQKWGRGAYKGGEEPVALKHGVRAHRVPKGSVAFVLQVLVMVEVCDGGGV